MKLECLIKKEKTTKVQNEETFNSLNEEVENHREYTKQKGLKLKVNGSEQDISKKDGNEDHNIKGMDYEGNCALLSVIHTLNSTQSFLISFGEHQRCNTSTCSLCLARSLILRSVDEKNPKDENGLFFD